MLKILTLFNIKLKKNIISHFYRSLQAYSCFSNKYGDGTRMNIDSLN